MKKVLLIFGILLLLIFSIFWVQKNKFPQKNLNILKYTTENIWNCVFEIYEKNDNLWNLKKQVGHTTVVRDWLFITNKHVIDLNKNYLLSGNWSSFDVDKIWFENEIDLAYLKLEKPINCNLSIGKITNLWQEIFTRVYRNGQNIKKTGNIIWLNEKIETNGIYYNNLILTNLKLEHGDSGSPLFDFDGNIIGVNTAISQKNNTTYSLPLEWLL